MSNLTLYSALDLTVRLACCGLAISSMELYSLKHHFTHQGVFSIGTAFPILRYPTLLHIVDKYLGILLRIQIVASITIVILGPFSPLGRLMLLVALLSAIAVRLRRRIGGDGAEQMTTITLVAACIAALPYASDNRIAVAGFFIVAQISLSYTTAGIAKLSSPLWRSGKALPALLSTFSHGAPGVVVLLTRYPLLSLLVSWGVIMFECLFPLLIFGPTWLLFFVLLIGSVFHICCAFIMGLNSFVWSFISLYFCVIAVTGLLSPFR